MKLLKLSTLATSIALITACGGGSNSSTTVTPTPPANAAPTVDAGDNISAAELTTVSLMATATDSDGTIALYNWSQTSGPAVELNADGANLSFTAPESTEEQTLSFNVTVTDSGGATASDTVDVTIFPNAAPTVTAGEDATAIEFTQVTITAMAEDSDGEIASYQWSQTAGQSVELTATDNAELSFTAPAASEEHTLSFEVVVTDNYGKTATDSIDIIIAPTPNELPVVDAGVDVTTTELSNITLTASAEDSDGEIVSYNWTQTAGTTVELATTDSAELTFTAPETDEEQTLTFTVTVTDNLGATSNDSVDVTISPSTSLDDIQFADSNLTQCLTQQANDNGWQRLIHITKLDCNGQFIHSLEGIEQLTQLKHLSVSDNLLNNIEPILNLTKLTSLDISNTNVPQSEIDKITTIKTWTHLGLASLSISSLQGFDDLNQLKSLNLRANSLVDVSAIAQLTELEILNVSNNDIVDISFIEPLTHLHSLFISYTKVKDISLVRNTKHWQQLGLASLELNNLDFLSEMEQLHYINISDNPIDNFSALAPLQQLTSIQAHELTGTLDLEPLVTLPLLTELDISNNRIDSNENYTHLAALTGLTSLNITSTDLTDVSAIGQLTSLVELEIERINTTDLSALANLAQLKRLILGTLTHNNETTEIGFLTSLTALKTLKISNINDKQAEAIGTLTSLEHLNISDALGRINLKHLQSLTNLLSLQAPIYEGVYNYSGLNQLTKLNYLYIKGENNGALSTIGELTQLRSLDLEIINDEQTSVSLSFLTQLSELRELYAYSTYFDFNTIADSLTNLIEFYNYDSTISNENLSKLTELSILYLAGNTFNNAEFLEHMPKLKRLSLDKVTITDFQPVTNLTNLTYFGIRNSQMENVDTLANLANLTNVYVRGKSITNIDVFSTMTQLRWLWVYDTSVSDISSLANLTNLNQLLLWRNDNLTDISALAPLTGLRTLYLGYSPIVNVESLFNLRQLDFLFLLRLNNVSCEDQNRLAEHFSYVEVITNYHDSCTLK